MRFARSFAVAVAAISSFTFFGCMAEHEDAQHEDTVGETEDALALASLYGSWTSDNGTIHSITFTRDAAQTLGGFLKGRGFSATIDNGVRCITTPCPSEDTVGGVYKLANGTKLTLASFDKPSLAFSKILGDYSVKLSGSSLVLTKKDTGVKQTFKKAKANFCLSDSDCRVVDDYCTGCDCRALSDSQELPVCSGPGVRCFAQPCAGKTAACVNHACAVQ